MTEIFIDKCKKDADLAPRVSKNEHLIVRSDILFRLIDSILLSDLLTGAYSLGICNLTLNSVSVQQDKN